MAVPVQGSEVYIIGIKFSEHIKTREELGKKERHQKKETHRFTNPNSQNDWKIRQTKATHVLGISGSPFSLCQGRFSSSQPEHVPSGVHETALWKHVIQVNCAPSSSQNTVKDMMSWIWVFVT